MCCVLVCCLFQTHGKSELHVWLLDSFHVRIDSMFFSLLFHSVSTFFDVFYQMRENFFSKLCCSYFGVYYNTFLRSIIKF
jgi:hypothetical protein